jgi:antitoxin HicB
MGTVLQHQNIGSSLDDFLKQEGIFEKAEGLATQEVIAWRLTEAMENQPLSQAAGAIDLRAGQV